MSTLKSAAVTTFLMPDFGVPAGLVLCRSAKYTTTQLLGTTETIQMIPIPKGAQILEVVLFASGASNVGIDVGDGTSPARFLGGVTLHTTDTVYRQGIQGRKGFLFQYTQDDTIDITNPSSDIDSGTVLGMNVFYKMAGSISDENFT